MASYMRDLHHYSLLSHNTFGIDVECDRLLEYATIEEACKIAALLTDADRPLLILGGGSNLLLTGNYHGTVLHSAIKGIEELPAKEGNADGEILLRCGSGEVWDDVVAYAVAHGYYGAENLSAIPGEVGASAVQNIGAYGVEVKDFIEEVEAVELATGQIRVFSNEDCQYSYRQSRFKHEWRDCYLVTHVTYRLSCVFTPHLDYGNIRAELVQEGIEHPTSQQLRQAIIRIREAKLPDPKVLGNAGSFFMNPIVDAEKFHCLQKLYPQMPYYEVATAGKLPGGYKIPAGWLIDQCGWKGRSLGRAGVHDKQALVLVNRGGATGADIVRLCRTIQHDVALRFGINIQPEVNIR